MTESNSANEEERIKIAARDWLLRLSVEEPTPADHVNFLTWCAEDARHAAAYRRFQAIWRDIGRLRELEPLLTADEDQQRWPRRLFAAARASTFRWAVPAALALVIALVGAWLFVSPTRYSTGVGELREIALSDGSAVTLGARSAVEVSLRGEERRVDLISGEAFFTVAHAAGRAFIVAVNDKRVRVVGTKFEAHRGAASLRVTTVEGAVEVTQAAGNDPQTRVVKAGEQLEATFNGPIGEPTLATDSEIAPWRHGRLVYVDARLSEVVADANRYSRLPITITDPQVGNLKVSVTCPTDRIDAMLSALPRSLPVRIERRPNRDILIKPGGPQNRLP